MTTVPLYQSLRSLADRCPLYFDMPGHHGRALPFFSPGDWTGLDRTEHGVTGDLFAGGDAIELAEQKWAHRWGAEGCLFLTGGSTQGVHTALHLCCRPGDTILVDRGSHRSLWHGLALLDVHPVYVPRPWDGEKEITGPLSPRLVRELWDAHPGARALFVTSPTYYGVDSDLRALADIAHQHGGVLVVDGAHGAHYPWVGQESPCTQGADLVILSAHKTLPVPGQSALLLYRGFHDQQVRQAGAVYGTSSPSYVMMAAMDGVRGWLDTTGDYLTLTRQLIPEFCTRMEKETPLYRVPTQDPARLVIATGDTGCTGFQILEELEGQNILIEMADLTHLVLICTCMDQRADFHRLLGALKSLQLTENRRSNTLPPPPELPQPVLSLRQAMFADTRSLDLQDCEGRIAGQQIAPYPPGVPVILPGERIEKKHLEYLKKIGYNNLHTRIIG